MSEVLLTVLYPWPKDTAQFESDYDAHLKLLHAKSGIPSEARPYTITKFHSGPDGDPPFYQMFSMPFASGQALQDTMSSEGMQQVAADAARISSGGAPTIMIGEPR
ncbi:ethyl tert-butyl ether degradation protein EthD [Ruegeria sp. ANG-R]|uniref:EthD family reductase n=1 Tax=Ruegeria sp. ANG-R TaxID=1577903 RepID=UPI00057ED6F5|nr:EthD family reductase [Ruegeria sp. ANG-R]KIC42348.1 ethyl tert-butyl ether degradation protein EthD [Ruegeria sp. ANG-R]